MYRLTVFLNVNPLDLQEHMRAFRFQPIHDGFGLRMDTKVFYLRPLSTNRNSKPSSAYHVYCDAKVDTVFYLLDMVFQTYDVKVTGVEYQWKDLSLTTQSIQQKGFRSRRVPGMYEKQGVYLVNPSSNEWILQKRKHFTLKQTYVCMREIEQLKDTLVPDTFDLFSYEQMA